ncbi:copper resistance protein [Buttiauxella selenatireducens]|uniref:Copper resistance protein n=1 Tax=Buttiauxella selenatireducens TaxID=3073902 RepID=A0ABY9SGX5_9ENTR|nr:copper resistance protein [Buttiauxella sp. R73]WMY76095.1 copper resistance protein [Buttiauxella sp. R73]
MLKQQQIAKWFLFLACLVVLVCTAQRMAGMHALQMKAAQSVMLTQNSVSDADEASAVTPCELSAKSLLASPPVLFEAALFIFSLIVTLLAPLLSRSSSLVPVREFSSPTLRVHLRFCVFRE